MAPRTVPFGAWPSPLSAEDLFAGVASPSDLLADGAQLWWTLQRPSDGGRTALVRWSGGEPEVVSPDGWDCRTRVHEYGGAPYAARDGVVVAADDEQQRWWRLGDGDPAPVTPAPAAPRGLRWADARLLPGAGRMVVVREQHHDDAREPSNELVLVDLDGDADAAPTTLVSGPDFVAAPRPSPDGTRLAWLQWDHPGMPWDAASCHVGRLDGDRLVDVHHVGGGPGGSACAPTWLDDDRIVVPLERDDRWRPTVVDVTGAAAPVLLDALTGEVGAPHWVFGTSSVAVLADGRLAAVVTTTGADRLRLLDPADPADAGSTVPGLGDLVAVRRLVAHGDGLAVLGTTAHGAAEVRTWAPDVGATTVAAWPMEGLASDDLPASTVMSFPTPDGATTHAVVHLPRREGVTGPDGELPPLLVFIHGGPTSHRAPAPSTQVAWWTTRGFAVADVNYRGSTGHGAAYRDALLGQWGVHDVTDVIAVAQGLAERGVVDGGRMAIRGGSAGGFTTLAALTRTEHPFACGTSFFGVADLALLAQDTHKFESRYLDGLVGPLPEAAATYRERSPLENAEHLRVPLLVLQGLEDAVVPPAQSEQIVAAAAANGVRHAYLAFEGEQHGFRRLENLVAWHEAELSFYGQVLGFEPAGDVPVLELQE